MSSASGIKSSEKWCPHGCGKKIVTKFGASKRKYYCSKCGKVTTLKKLRAFWREKD